MALYLLAFCRVVIGLVFIVSSISKALNISKFRQTIISFGLLPRSLTGIAAILFLCCEFAVAGLAAIGGEFLLPSFLLAIILLLIFCGALASVLVRRLRTPCNCFGSSEKPISIGDVWRNVGFILCALGGCVALTWTQRTSERLGVVEWLLTALGAGVFVAIWIQLREIAQLFCSD